MTAIPLNDPKWRDSAECNGADIDFFDFATYREKNEAKQLCLKCPVRMHCLNDALVNEDRFGMWGGVDEQEIRRALSIDQFGKPTTRRKPPRCPNCKNEQLTVLEKRRTRSRVQCEKCTLSWWTRRTMTKRMRATQ